MKKYSVLLVVLTLFASNVFADKEAVASWSSLYAETKDLDQKFAVVNKVIELHDKDATEFLRGALQDFLTKKIEEGTPTEKFQKNRLVKAVIIELGNLQDIDSAEAIYRVYREVNEPFLKGEAAVALGKLRAVSFAEKLIQDLKDKNLQPPQDQRRDFEILASGLIQGLTAMRVKEGYEAVFLASTSWYTGASKVKDLAKSSLVLMVDDPTDVLINIISQNKNLEIKIAALEAELASKATKDNKLTVARRGLKEGVQNATTNVEDSTTARLLRLNAMKALIALGDKSSESVGFLKEIIANDKVNDASLDETLNAFVALGVNGNDDAAKFLADSLKNYNDRQLKVANSPRDKIIIMQILDSIAVSKNKLAKPAVEQALVVGHDNNIKRKAELVTAALK